MVTRHNFESITLRIRWIDYARIRNMFPAEKNESATSYFRRLALYLKMYGFGNLK